MVDLIPFKVYNKSIKRKAKRQEETKMKDTRTEALNILYNIPGYKEAELETKNYIYDELIKKLNKINK